MALSVQSIKPSTLSGVTTAKPGTIAGVVNAKPGAVTIGSNYGLQGYGSTGNSNSPLTINVPSSTPAPTVPQPDSSAIARQQATAAAAAEEARKRRALIGQIDASYKNIETEGQSSLRDLTTAYSQQNRNATQQLQTGQDTINRSRENIALNLRRGMQSIIGNIRQGYNQGRTAISGANATDSGATADLARALARQSGEQVGDARNDAYLQNQGVDIQQGYLDQDRENAVADFLTYRQQNVESISTSLYDRLRTLDANAQANDINGQVDFGLRDRLINDAIAQLNAIDKQTSELLGGVKPQDQSQTNANARALDQGGAVGYQMPYRLVV